MHRVAAVTVTYNRKEYLTRNIKSLLTQSTDDLDVFIIDNASTDGTRDALKGFIDENKITYVNTGANLGGAGGFNFGMKYVAKLGYEFIWLMDDDCIPDADALSALLRADETLGGNYGFLSSVAYYGDGELCNMNIQKNGLKTKIELNGERLIPAIMATFVSFFVKTKTVEEVGLPIKDFFIWSDDLEYSRRISRKYDSFVVSDSTVLHDMKSNAKVNIADESPERLDRYKYLYRNEVYVYRREGINGWIYLLLRISLHLAKVIVKGSDKTKKCSVIFKSFIKGLTFKPEIEFLD